MRTVVLLALLFLSACSVVPPQAWTFDPRTPPAKVALAAEEAAAMTNRLAQLQTERYRIRAQIAAEGDARQRLEHYRQLHEVVSELAPLDRQLAAAANAR